MLWNRQREESFILILVRYYRKYFPITIAVRTYVHTLLLLASVVFLGTHKSMDMNNVSALYLLSLNLERLACLGKSFFRIRLLSYIRTCTYGRYVCRYLVYICENILSATGNNLTYSSAYVAV